MKEKVIHINCDLGEGGGSDAQLMPFLSACNIACGGHYGDRQSVAYTVELAMQYSVKIGAHPAYPDRKNFGRKTMDISLDALRNTIIEQIERVKTQAEKRGGQLHHVKPHGALYNDIVKDPEKAAVVVRSILEVDNHLILFAPPRAVVRNLAKGKLRVWTEGFMDRGYNADFSLVARDKEGAVLQSKEAVFKRALSLALTGSIEAVNHEILQADFDTLCLHSDTENAVEILKYVYKELTAHHISIYK